MEAKELMVGDLIRYPQDQCLTDEDKAPLTVTCVGAPEYPDYMPFIKVKGSNEKYHQDLFYPIPLTVEILEKNRWFEIFKDKYEGHISLAKVETTCFRIKNTNICLRFVHELQHALRLCKLNEVADNLKV